jgi:hypothetical protein
MTLNRRSGRVAALVALIFMMQESQAFVSLPQNVRGGTSVTRLSYVESTQLSADHVPPKKSKPKKTPLAKPVKKNKFLEDLHLPRGLRDALMENTQSVFSKRIWIVDNSGSMKMMDGHEIVHSMEEMDNRHKNKKQPQHYSTSMVEPVPVTPSINRNDNTRGAAVSSVTRWAEVQETVKTHIMFNSALGVPTDFRLLNPPSCGGPQNFRVGYSNQGMSMIPGVLAFGKRSTGSDCQRAEKIMRRNQPSGKTPLHTAVQQVRKEVIRMLPQLRADGTKVAIVICTDGCNHDYRRGGDIEPQLNQELREALESLQGLPVCVVIRLCTDYGQIVDFYNDLDEELGEASFLDVLDDYEAEAAEVQSHNPWLNYALVLHRLREMGMQGSSALFDLLDERPFTRDEIRDFCGLMFGTDLLPDPWYDWENFLSEIDRLQQREALHWNPEQNAMVPWIDMEQLAMVQ